MLFESPRYINICINIVIDYSKTNYWILVQSESGATRLNLNSTVAGDGCSLIIVQSQARLMDRPANCSLQALQSAAPQTVGCRSSLQWCSQTDIISHQLIFYCS